MLWAFVQWYLAAAFITSAAVITRGICVAIVDDLDRQRAFVAEMRFAETDICSAERWDRAQKTAFALLRAWLSPAQLDQYGKHGAFLVRGSHGGRYAVTANGMNFNCIELDADGNALRKLCAHPYGASGTMGDIMLAQKIGLEVNEEVFLRVANAAAAGDIESPYGYLLDSAA